MGWLIFILCVLVVILFMLYLDLGHRFFALVGCMEDMASRQESHRVVIAALIKNQELLADIEGLKREIRAENMSRFH